MKPTLVYVASRWPWPIASGRQRMIAQTLEVAARTHEIVLIAVSNDAHPGSAIPGYVAKTVHLRRPGVISSAISVIFEPHAPLQSHLFAAGETSKAILREIADTKPSVVMLDMIRLAGLVEDIRLVSANSRVIVDMDDRLSDRYRQMRRGGERNLLGSYAAKTPSLLKRIAGIAPGLLLGLEARLTANAEARAARQADAVVLVSPREARNYHTDFARTGLEVVAIPPSVEKAVVARRDFSHGIRFVFLGNANYAPNAQALRYLDAMAGRLKGDAASRTSFSFQAAGPGTESFPLEHVEGLGFVADLDSFLGPDAVMVAPIVTGTGIKTKLLDAMARGVPIITTLKGVEGLDLQEGIDAVVCASPDMIEKTIGNLVAEGGRKDVLSWLGMASAAVARKDHDPETIAATITGLLNRERDLLRVAA
ncbi:glycosyltransferase family 4 protein [Bosea sp. RAC05]|uniref:glycosyltransferase family 4 protein n=1 Tax=Bosea sp. RAC05 TaxID=1842539 RepID=UPI00083E083E|nr:glycosyltransferase family 4 protein [Bosea sp. RAC05]AOG02839.1 glycosyl transferase 4-like domain protein [Bosea sp. RAC05]